MSQEGNPHPTGPGEGPELGAEKDKGSSWIVRPPEHCDGDRTAAGERDITEPSNKQSVQANTQDQPVLGNCTGGDLIRTQPQRLPLPNAVPLEKCKEETGKIQNGHACPNHGSGFRNGVKPGIPDGSRRFSAPVSQKMHKKIQSSLSVNSGSSKKSTAYSHKAGSLPEDCCVHCILACLFCEFITLCSLVLEQASCGICPAEACCCCCGEEMGDDCNCPCDMDCGIMDACCESSDCLEICMECCGICFPS
ncbi:myoD family inhibitor domain-containing protein isoform X1 [Anolis carolinensis]|uniref:MyoD family inhibitor domain containing n=1 Tax=Anolis carolinensis TaxID=28377 RepID=G1KFM4_ANOCA|nr:PREDICTED: myoD family inhibitor domain-containing protein isoform X1 [Anolis carolinensis]|eukprot:XP_003221258.1 PREDICTED: myoD family inhibitor domain-containing protein isoform X1 [Anolis carolinensis]